MWKSLNARIKEFDLKGALFLIFLPDELVRETGEPLPRSQGWNRE
jgi:hypothetical protein